MKNLFLLLPFLLLLACNPPAQEPEGPTFPEGKWVDLTHTFDKSTVYWPTSRAFGFDTVFAGLTEAGYYYSAFNFQTAEHGGTHMDAPVHFAKGHAPVEQVPIEQLIGPGVVVDVSAKAKGNRDYLVSVEDLQAWEAINGQMPDGAIVLLFTGFGEYWPNAEQYMGTAERGPAAVPKLHFPGLDPKAATWLTENRKIGAIGLDTPSIDFGQSTLYESHRILFAKDIPAFENVGNLDQLPASGSWIIALPMKIKGGSGAPLRIVAWLGG